MANIVRTFRRSKVHLGRASTALALWGAFGLLGVIATSSAKGQTFTVLHSFTNSPDGANPFGGLLRDAAGNLYGTTFSGGLCNSYNCGTVFKLDSAGNEIVLYRFGTAPLDASDPYASLVRDSAGNLYGTARDGGSSGGFGAVFKIDISGKETILHSFTFSNGDGFGPYGGLLLDAAGNLYGTAAGGTYGYGIIFKLDSAGSNYTVLHEFTLADGAGPTAAPIMDAAGNLYGTTGGGGSSIYTGVCTVDITNVGCGTVYELDTSGNLTVLHNFTGADGWGPISPLIRDGAGNLYGTTAAGGSTVGPCTLGGGLGQNGCGTVFKLDRSGNLTVLHNFTAGSDGAAPYYGALVMDTVGNLYGTTAAGGPGPCTGRYAIIVGCGTVFKLDPAGNETVLYSFTGGSDGGVPYGGLAMDGTGNLYGMTNQSLALSNYGTVFKLTVQTPQQATQSIIDSVNMLYSQSVLSAGQDNSFVKELQQAIKLMNAGKNAGAIQNLNLFISEVNDLLGSGVLSSSQATPLISAAKAIIARLS